LARLIEVNVRFPYPVPVRTMTQHSTNGAPVSAKGRTPRGNRFHRTYTYAEARAIFVAVTIERGCTPSRPQVPHVRAVLNGLGCKNMTEAAKHLGLVPNVRGPLQAPLPDGWTGECEPYLVASDLAAERAASLARQRARNETREAEVRPRHIPKPRDDDFAEPADLCAAAPAWWGGR